MSKYEWKNPESNILILEHDSQVRLLCLGPSAFWDAMNRDPRTVKIEEGYCLDQGRSDDSSNPLNGMGLSEAVAYVESTIHNSESQAK